MFCFKIYHKDIGVWKRMCVCSCSSTCWFLQAAWRLWHTWDVRINDLLLWVLSRMLKSLVKSSLIFLVLFGASAKFLHFYFWIYHISPRKTKTPADSYWYEKTNAIMLTIKKMIYFDIGYKPVQRPKQTVTER